RLGIGMHGSFGPRMAAPSLLDFLQEIGAHQCFLDHLVSAANKGSDQVEADSLEGGSKNINACLSPFPIGQYLLLLGMSQAKVNLKHSLTVTIAETFHNPHDQIHPRGMGGELRIIANVVAAKCAPVDVPEPKGARVLGKIKNVTLQMAPFR